MTHQINNETVYDAIQSLYREVFIRAETMGLPTENMAIYIHPDMAKALELQEILTVFSAKGDEIEIPIIRDSNYTEKRSLEGNEWLSNIYIASPDWEWKPE